MKRLFVVSLSILLVVGLFAGSALAFRGHGSMMRRDFAGEDIEEEYLYEELTEEELAELEEFERQMLRLSEQISVLREEYRQSIIDDASEEELVELEDRLFELQDEMAEQKYESDFRGFQRGDIRDDSGFRGMMKGFRGSSSRGGFHCW